MTLDEAIAKAKADGDVQLAEWLRQVRGADAAARWYTEKLRELEDENARLRSCMSDDAENARMIMGENAELRELVADMLHDAMENVCSKSYWCEEKSWQTCNDKSCGSRLYVEMAHKLGIEVN